MTTSELPLARLEPETICVFRTGQGDEGGLRVSARCRIADDVTFDTVRLQTAFWAVDGRLLGCEESAIDLDFLTDGVVLFTLNPWPSGVAFASVARIELRTFARGRLFVGDASFAADEIQTQHGVGRTGLKVVNLGQHEVGILRRPDSSDMNLDVIGRLRQPAGIPYRDGRLTTTLHDAHDRIIAKDESTVELARFDSVGASEPTPFRATAWYKLGLWDISSRVGVRLDLTVQDSSGPLVITAAEFLSAAPPSPSLDTHESEPAADTMTSDGVDE